MTDALTAKQEAFCVYFIETGNAAESYRRSHELEPDVRDDWIYVEACRMLAHPKVAPRIAELRKRATEVAAYGILDAVDEYEDARLMAKAVGSPAAAVAAINGKVKLFGLDKPTKIDNVSSDGSMTPQIITRRVVDPRTDGA